jgi:hypothetical protein
MDRERDSANLAGHILPVSATMVGVCMTVISLVQIIPKNAVSNWVDGLLAVDNLLFLVSASMSYVAIRRPEVSLQMEQRADTFFMVALLVMVCAGFMVAFDLFIE